MTAPAMSFAPEGASVPAARRFVRTTLDGVGLLAAWHAAELLVSEVVTNAVLHARTEFSVGLVRDGDVVRVSVTDGSTAVPRPRAYGTDATTGRGLRLVATLALAWGVDGTSTGKTVWFEVPAGGEAETAVEAWDADVDIEALLTRFGDPGDRAGLQAAPTVVVHGRRASWTTRGAGSSDIASRRTRELLAYRRWHLGEITAQLAGVAPTPWQQHRDSAVGRSA